MSAGLFLSQPSLLCVSPSSTTNHRFTGATEEYKFVELLSLSFDASPEEATNRQGRGNAIRGSCHFPALCTI